MDIYFAPEKPKGVPGQNWVRTLPDRGFFPNGQAFVSSFSLLSGCSGFFLCPALADEQELAKKSQNPVAAMISLPMKNKFNFGRGDKDAFAYGQRGTFYIPYVNQIF